MTLGIMGFHFSSRLTATLNLCPIYFKITRALSTKLEHMHKKFEINQTKIKGSCQTGRKVVPHDSKRNLPLLRFSTVSYKKKLRVCRLLVAIGYSQFLFYVFPSKFTYLLCTVHLEDFQFSGSFLGMTNTNKSFKKSTYELGINFQ